MRNTQQNRKATQGFTLIELLIVIAIIGILAAVLIPNLLNARNRANDTATQSWIRECVTGVETNRDAVTQALNTTITTCQAATGKPVPAAVSSTASGTISYTGQDTYTISASSAQGNPFTYNGTTIVAGN